MCGICGFVKLRKDSKHINEQYLMDMNNEMLLRGPDGGGVWLHKENIAGLGHRRLSIIDLSDAASQPMSNEDGTVYVSFNGEIYNHAEIRRELKSTGGHVWKTDHSDTEVIIHAYEQWGIDCIKKFRGMFGIALYDCKNEKLYLIRDRMGIKPVYYSVSNDMLTFASSINAILKAKTGRSEINKKSLYDYLSFGATYGPDTMLSGIKRLVAGEYLCVENGNISKRQYYDVLDYLREDIAAASEDEIQEALISELRISVKLRKMSDVPIGVFLSGGIDSSTIAALFTEGKTEKVKSFCIGYDGFNNNKNYKYQNENHYARQMADFCGAEYYEQLLRLEDVSTGMPNFVRFMEDPIADRTYIANYYVSRLARDNGIVVCQSGEGSDELFWGYGSFRNYLKLLDRIKFKIPDSAKKIFLFSANIARKADTKYYEIMKRSLNNEPVSYVLSEYIYDNEKQKIINEDVRNELKGYTSFDTIKDTYECFKEKSPGKTLVDWISYSDLRFKLPENYLMRVDKMSMANSLECRVPFLDHKFVELAMSIPAGIKIKNYDKKYILKKAIRGFIPDNLIDRKKQGFDVPIADWSMNKFGHDLKDEITNFTKQTGLFNTNYIKNMTDSNKIFLIYNFVVWYKQYIIT